jgi:Zn-dependent M16 (insulinase) family peptidase
MKINQLYTASLESLSSDALSACISRVSARYDKLSAMREYLYGYEFHRFLRAAVDDTESVVYDIARVTERIKNEYLTRERLILSVTSEDGMAAVNNILSKIKTGGALPECVIVNLLAKKNEAIKIHGSVGYAAYGSNIITELGEKYRGSLGALTSILTYEYLWPEIRVRGGAYDTGIVTRGGSGGVITYSYRDPSPTDSLRVFKKMTDIATSIADNTDITKYIISTLGSMDTVSTPRSDASSANLLYLSNKPENHTEIIRQQILSTDIGEIKRLISILASLEMSSTYCIALSEDPPSDCEAILEI